MKKLFFCLFFLCCSNVYAINEYQHEDNQCNARPEVCSLSKYEQEDFNCDSLTIPNPNYYDPINDCHSLKKLKASYLKLQNEFTLVYEDSEFLLAQYITSAYKYAQKSCRFSASNTILEHQPALYLSCMNKRLIMLLEELEDEHFNLG